MRSSQRLALVCGLVLASVGTLFYLVSGLSSFQVLPTSLANGAGAAAGVPPVSPHSPTAAIPAAPARPNLHMLFPATHFDRGGCKTLLTALLHGYDPVVINFGNKAKGGEARQIKVKGVTDYIRNNVTEPNDLVFMIDAFDVWLQQPPSVLVEKFLARSNPNVLIGADKRCWPIPPDPAECTAIPESPLPREAYGPNTDTGSEDNPHDHTYYLNRPRWPNSGTIIAQQSLLKPLYQDLTQLATQRDATKGDQQLFMTLFYSAADKHPLALDYTSSLFQTLTYSEHDVVFIPSQTHLQKVSPIELLGVNKISGETPIALHFNGGEKKLLADDQWWKDMWWISGGRGNAKERAIVRARARKAVERSGGVQIAETGERKTWKDVCGAFAEGDDGLWGRSA